ncbi:MAG: hypothetical protein NZL85_06735, partial [Fimbriimonadales bacterium]|nr:hypothetical protein [Fimbriimonadales bacterium]
MAQREGFVLLKYHLPDGRALWLEGDRPLATIQARTHGEVLFALAEVERAVRTGLAAVGFVCYEAAHGFDPAFPKMQVSLPLVWFALYQTLIAVEPQGKREVHPRQLPVEQVRSPRDWYPTMTQAEYDHALQRIRDYILAGDTYQVNFSFRLRAPFHGDPLALFWRLYRCQP